MEARAGQPFEAESNFGTTGLVGTIGVTILDGVGGITTPRTTAGIIEVDSFGIYLTTLIAPALTGQYVVMWDDGTDAASDDLTVIPADAPLPDSELPPAMPVGAPALGPCTAWTTPEMVADCLDVEVGSDNVELLDLFAIEASMTLFEKSGRQFTGSCDRSARPCREDCGWCGQVLSRGHLVNWDGRGWDDCGLYCGCSPLSRVLLPGYPVTEILEVSIGDETIDPDAYRLDAWRWLTRTDGSRWPACQNLAAETGESGSFVVRYRSGVNPPPIGMRAAAELAAQLALACPGAIEGAVGDCQLPIGTTSIQRLGVTIQLAGFVSWAFQNGRWQTGLPLVDAFLNTYNPHGLRRRAAVFSPDGPQFAERVGT